MPASEAIFGAITIAGNGLELGVFGRLTRASEKTHLGVVAEIRSDASCHSIAMVKSGEADFPVSGERDLDAVPFA